MKDLSKLVASQNLQTITQDMTIYEAAKLMKSKNIGAVLITKNEKIIGIVTERDLLNKVIAQGLDYKNAEIKEIMSTNLRTVDVGDSIESCFKPMKEIGCRHLPIIEKEKVVGIVSLRDVMDTIIENLADERDQLNKYIRSY